ncbi:glycoside hydrolase family 3 C-terminal domain-containing protein [Ramlibacter sp. XY19]|uniref:glycoside hydrolase family 3 protein n=1 Tax=Ramlibacter paludis TaxID=2908000 RepID=UPI0023DC076A|nr:glycoside hydrolase family 3 N-terminal domain-containing protein [Ramlibacter paludis]MCG2592398.1 glycoside hydrolase family 3 C-terminal domain-containing protein [Ramlibacter paludis]
MMNRTLRRATLPLALAATVVAVTSCGGGNTRFEQPVIGARQKAVLTVDSYRFRDANGNGQLDAYEDWRLSAQARAADLVARMSLDDKAGLMMIDTLNPDFGGAVANPANDYLVNQRMRRFIFRSTVTGSPVLSASPGLNGQAVTPLQAATWTNAIQEIAEASSLGIPVLFKSNARNHYDRAARFGTTSDAGAFSEWPKEPGLAATRDLALIKDFAQTMGAEWKAIGLRGMYGYMADTATEPRWFRINETFSEDFDLNADIVRTLVENLQGGPVNPNTPVALTMKHFPGGGPQEMGLDPHYSFGKNQVYPAGQFGNHLKPFKAAIDSGVSAIMPYYGVPIDVTYEGVRYDQIGFAFSQQIVNDLLRGKLGFKGYVNTDTGVVTDRAWGLEGKTVPERVAAAINAGNDLLSGFHSRQTILDLVAAGLVTPGRIDEAVTRVLIEQFQLGLFENPYVDAAQAANVVGNADARAKAMDAQRKSIVLLQNLPRGSGKTLPLPAPTATAPVKIYTMGLNAGVVGGADYGGYTVVNGDYGRGTPNATRPSAAGADYAIIRVEVTNPYAPSTAGPFATPTGLYRSKDPLWGANPAFIDPRTGKTWGAQDSCVLQPVLNPVCVDDAVGLLGPGTAAGLLFGGSLPWEGNNLSFTTMAASASWQVAPKLGDIQAVMNEVGADRVILAIYFRQPYVLDEASGMRKAGAILAGFGVSDAALMDVVTGKFAPKGKLPFALANNLQAVIANDPDAPGYPAADTLFPFGFGLGY